MIPATPGPVLESAHRPAASVVRDRGDPRDAGLVGVTLGEPVASVVRDRGDPRDMLNLNITVTGPDGLQWFGIVVIPATGH